MEEQKNFKCPSLLEETTIEHTTFVSSFFASVELKQVTFYHVTFSCCDFSGTNCSFVDFTHCQFIECKGIGTNFEHCCFKYNTFKECQFSYSVFIKSRLEHIEFLKSNFSNSYFSLIKWIDWTFEQTNLEYSQWIDTPLKGIDVSHCMISGIQASEYQGIIVNVEQALALSLLLGIEIKEI